MKIMTIFFKAEDSFQIKRLGEGQIILKYVFFLTAVSFLLNTARIISITFVIIFTIFEYFFKDIFGK